MSAPIKQPTIYMATLVVTALACAQPTRALRNVKVGDTIPAFSVRALDEAGIDGSGYRGKVLLLLFVRPEHAGSLRALKTAQRIYRAFDASELAVLAVSTKPDAGESMKRCSAEHGIGYPIALDPGRKMYGDFGLIVAPTTLLVDREGVLRFELAHLPPNYDRRVRLHAELLLGKLDQAQHDAAIEKLKAGGERSQIDPTRRQTSLARMLMEQGKYDQAIAVLTPLVEEKKGPVSMAVLLGNCHLALGDLEKAAKYLDPLADGESKGPKLAQALGRLELARGNLPQAEAYLQQALARSPKKGQIWYDLGRLQEKKGLLEKAADYYRKALAEVYGPGP